MLLKIEWIVAKMRLTGNGFVILCTSPIPHPFPQNDVDVYYDQMS